MKFEIIDFHTHPFNGPENNICNHKDYCNMSADETVNVFKRLGVFKICGSVISSRAPEKKNCWEEIKHNNDTALELKKTTVIFIYWVFIYIPIFLNNL